MPVDATPVNGASCTTQLPQYPGSVTPQTLAVSCENRNVFSTQIGENAITGEPILQRMRSVKIPGKQAAVIKHIMRTDTGSPVDLRICVCQDTDSVSFSSSAVEDCVYAVKFRMQESLSFVAEEPMLELTADVTNGEAGEVTVTLTPAQLTLPGVYSGQFSLVQLATEEDAEDIVILSNMIFVVIGRSLATPNSSGSVFGPPSIAEVRLFLRDSAPLESTLLESVKFSDEEIAYAIQMPIMYWNEIPPPLNPVYNTSNFPYRYHWLIAITGHLFMIAAEQNRANNLQYTAGGTAVNDQNKEVPYESAADRRLQEWRSFVMRKKASINIQAGFGGIGGYTAW